MTVRASDQTTSAIEGDVSEGDEVLLDPYSAPDAGMDADGGSMAVADDAAVAEGGAEPTTDADAEPTAATDAAA